MPEPSSFDYAIVRVVPHVEREEFVNVGVVLLCRSARFLKARIELNPRRLAVLPPDLDTGMLQDQIDVIHRLCAGGPGTGPIGELSQAERFRWITSPRSTTIQFSPIHCGLSDDPQAALDEVFEKMIG